MRITHIWIPVLLAIVLAGCDHANYKMEGTEHARVKPAAVLLYATPPVHYQTIAEVSAGSHYGWSEHSRVAHVVDLLKQQAAKLGANGVIVEHASTKPIGKFSISIPGAGILLFLIAEGKEINIQGEAIYVPPSGAKVSVNH